MLRIESADNSRLKQVRKLRNKKSRDEECKFVIEGINLVEEAVRKGVAIDYILIADDFQADAIVESAESNGICVCELPAQLLNKLSDAEFGVGIMAVINKPDFDIQDAIADGGNVLVLDKVQDPGNIGTMIRTAVAAGYSMILAVKGTADVYSSKVLRATAGMIFDIPIVYVDDAKELCEFLNKLGKRIVVTLPTAIKAYYEEDLKSGIALVIGNEGNGISQEVIDIADIGVTIPMKGEIESLNAAVSAAILMYEAIR